MGQAMWSVATFGGSLSIILVSWLIVLCLLWAPVAGGICTVLAKARGIDVRHHTVAAGVYSIILFFPWVYLVIRMIGLRPPRSLVAIVYVGLFSLWLLGPIAGGYVQYELTDLRSTGYEETLFEHYPGVALALTLASFGTWIMSIVMVYQQASKPSPRVEYGSVLPERVYVMPFALASLWFLLIYAGMWDEPPPFIENWLESFGQS